MTNKNKQVFSEELLNAIADAIRLMGDYLIKYGTIEKQVDLDEFFNRIKDPTELFEAIREMPEDVGREFGALMFSFMKILSIKKDISAMTPDEKIQIGGELKKISRRIKRIAKKIKKYER